MKHLNEFLAGCSGAARFLAFLLLCACFVPAALIYEHLDNKNPTALTQKFFKVLLHILGIRLRLSGGPVDYRPVLFVANHVSYLDILVLGALLPAVFVAKAEVESWPLFGFLSRIQNTVFIERRAARASDHLDLLRRELERKNLILFPEGTSSEGLSVLRFKSSLFHIFEDAGIGSSLSVQPISMTCVGLNGRPIKRTERPLYAWFGDMTLAPHLWHVFKHGRFTVDVKFHNPLMACGSDRKYLANACQEIVARGIEQSLAAMPPETA